MSSSMQIGSRGLAKLRAKLGRIPPAVNDGLRKHIETASFRIWRDARASVPVDEGDLQRSIQSEFSDDGLVARVGTNMVYGPAIEFGTRHTEKQPYVFPAAETERPRFRSRAARLTRKALKDAAR